MSRKYPCIKSLISRLILLAINELLEVESGRGSLGYWKNDFKGNCGTLISSSPSIPFSPLPSTHSVLFSLSSTSLFFPTSYFLTVYEKSNLTLQCFLFKPQGQITTDSNSKAVSSNNPFSLIN